MAVTKTKAKPQTWTKGCRESFLTRLAETSNVAASARTAKMPVGSVYALRRKSPEFRAAWAEALAEGYARLEASLLEAALKKVSGAVDVDELKRQAQGHRLGLSLLAQHRPSVKGAVIAVPTFDGKALKRILIERIGQMHQRIEAAADRGSGGADDETHG